MSTPKGKTKIMLLAMSSIFFVTYLFLYIGGVPLVGDKALPYLIFNQPDESINYAFIREYVLEGNRQIQEPLLDLTENQVHPRSTTVVNGALTPIGFPGVIILFGAIVKGLTAISGLEFFNIILLTLTPLCAVIAPWFLYGVIRRIWGEHIGIMSAILVYILPGWWYYASRPLQHTILFVTLLLIGSYAALKMKEAVKETKQITWGLLAGLGISLALFVRPSEVLWVSAIALGFLLIHKKDVTKHVIRGGILGIILIALLFFFGQLSYYGHVFGTGYAPPTSIGSAGQITEGLFGNDSIIKSIVLPFGFNARAIVKHIIEYGPKVFTMWFWVPAIFLGCFLIRWKSLAIATYTKEKRYVLMLLGVSLYLMIVYGSWGFTDNLAEVPSIGTSYVRYTLPLYILSLPLVASVLYFIWKRIRLGKVLASILLLSLVYTSYMLVFSSFDGLLGVKQSVSSYYEYQKDIVTHTEDNAVIVTRYGDKYIYPKRKVIKGFTLDIQRKAIPILLEKGVPVYLYDLTLSKEHEALLKKDGEEKGYRLQEAILTLENNLELRPFILHSINE